MFFSWRTFGVIAKFQRLNGLIYLDWWGVGGGGGEGVSSEENQILYL